MAYANTDHLFSQPIRTYKANDPYYYEVDNIPIRQLEENVLWVKDQIDSLIAPQGDPVTGSPLFVGDDIDLEDIKQLRPKYVGGRYVSVNAGRFTARVNDAFDVRESLATLIATFGIPDTCANVPDITQNNTEAFFDSIWESYTKKLTSATHISCPGESFTAGGTRSNGLETMYTFYMTQDFGYPIPSKGSTTYGAPEYELVQGQGKTWPALWNLALSNWPSSWPTAGSQALYGLNTNHIKMVQHWRGVIRTSVVDFRGESIEIAPFSKYDYWYAETVNGTQVETSLEDLASQRIDLLVVYTQPIDASGATLSEYNGVRNVASLPGDPVGLTGIVGTPKKITTPRLGIIRGAGIGIKRGISGAHAGGIELLDKRIAPGEQKILANLNDHTDGGSNTGIRLRNGTIVHGSFPSPDDLANIAPNLTLSLADNDLQLIGQTALPIAYIVVDKGSDNLTQDDIIDIRPFFRTTELAYNERAGIAAASPPISFANPVVGQAQIVKVAKCIEGQIDTKITQALGIAPHPNALVSLGYVEITEATEDIVFTSVFDDNLFYSYELHSTVMIGESGRRFPSWSNNGTNSKPTFAGAYNTQFASWSDSFPYFVAVNFSKDNGMNWDTTAKYNTMLAGGDASWKGTGWANKNMGGITPILSEGQHSFISQVFTLSGGPALITTTGEAQCKTTRTLNDDPNFSPSFHQWGGSLGNPNFDRNGSFTPFSTKVWIEEDSDYLSGQNSQGALRITLGTEKFSTTIQSTTVGGSGLVGQRPKFKVGSNFMLYGRLKS